MTRSVLRRLGERRVLALLACAGYVAAARLAVNFYPLSVYDMYASRAESSSSRIVARDEHGNLREVTDFGEWSCTFPVQAQPTQCAQFPFYYVPYLDREAIDWVNRRSSSGGSERVDVVYQIWRFSTEREMHSETCVIARCTASIR
jgi:hypothetical protein